MSVLLLLLSLSLTTKSSDFKYDENGRIIYSEVVKTEVENDLLLENAADYFSFEAKEEDGHGIPQYFEKTIATKLYQKKLFLSPHGEVRFKLELEIRESRYRYVITDFVFYPYERNRYGRFEEIPKAEKPLAYYLDEPNKTWRDHEETIRNKVEKVVARLKESMLAEPKEEEKKEISVLSDDW